MGLRVGSWPTTKFVKGTEGGIHAKRGDGAGILMGLSFWKGQGPTHLTHFRFRVSVICFIWNQIRVASLRAASFLHFCFVVLFIFSSHAYLNKASAHGHQAPPSAPSSFMVKHSCDKER